MKISNGLPNPLSSFLTDSVSNFRIRGTSYWEGTTGFDGGCVRVQDTDGNFLRTSSSSQVSGNILHRLNEPEWYFLMSELFYSGCFFFTSSSFFFALSFDVMARKAVRKNIDLFFSLLTILFGYLYICGNDLRIFTSFYKIMFVTAHVIAVLVYASLFIGTWITSAS